MAQLVPVNAGSASNSDAEREGVVFRVWNRQGQASAYRIYPARAGAEIGKSVAELVENPRMPDWLKTTIKPILDTALFALRHGSVQGMLKKSGLTAQGRGWDYFQARHQGEPNAANNAALDALCAMVFASVYRPQLDPAGRPLPVDVTSDDLMGGFTGLLERLPGADTDYAQMVRDQADYEGKPVAVWLREHPQDAELLREFTDRGFVDALDTASAPE